MLPLLLFAVYLVVAPCVFFSLSWRDREKHYEDAYGATLISMISLFWPFYLIVASIYGLGWLGSRPFVWAYEKIQKW